MNKPLDDFSFGGLLLLSTTFIYIFLKKVPFWENNYLIFVLSILFVL